MLQMGNNIQGFIQDFEFGGETPKFGVDTEGVL